MRDFNRVYLDARKVISVAKRAGVWHAKHPKGSAAKGTMRDQALTRCAMKAAKRMMKAKVH